MVFNLALKFFLTIHLPGCATRWGFPGGLVVKNIPATAGDARDMGLIPGSGESPEEGNGNLLRTLA